MAHLYQREQCEDLAVEGDMVWPATDGGVVRWDRRDGSYVKYATADGLTDNWVNAIAIDDAGRKWFGTNGGRVSKFDGTKWTTYTTDDGLAPNRRFTLYTCQGRASSMKEEQRTMRV